MAEPRRPPRRMEPSGPYGRSGSPPAEATFDPLPVDTEAARADDRVAPPHRHEVSTGVAGLLIPAVALANALPMVTRNSGVLRNLKP